MSDSLFRQPPPPDPPTRGAAPASAPLAAGLRPRTIEEVVGQGHLAEGAPLRAAIDRDALGSVLLWGPPGTGKTTLAHVIAASTQAPLRAIARAANVRLLAPGGWSGDPRRIRRVWSAEGRSQPVEDGRTCETS
jgi:putative ATPase